MKKYISVGILISCLVMGCSSNLPIINPLTLDSPDKFHVMTGEHIKLFKGPDGIFQMPYASMDISDYSTLYGFKILRFMGQDHDITEDALKKYYCYYIEDQQGGIFDCIERWNYFLTLTTSLNVDDSMTEDLKTLLNDTYSDGYFICKSYLDEGTSPDDLLYIKLNHTMLSLKVAKVAGLILSVEQQKQIKHWLTHQLKNSDSTFALLFYVNESFNTLGEKFPVDLIKPIDYFPQHINSSFDLLDLYHAVNLYKQGVIKVSQAEIKYLQNTLSPHVLAWEDLGSIYRYLYICENLNIPISSELKTNIIKYVKAMQRPDGFFPTITRLQEGYMQEYYVHSIFSILDYEISELIISGDDLIESLVSSNPMHPYEQYVRVQLLYLKKVPISNKVNAHIVNNALKWIPDQLSINDVYPWSSLMHTLHKLNYRFSEEVLPNNITQVLNDIFQLKKPFQVDGDDGLLWELMLLDGLSVSGLLDKELKSNIQNFLQQIELNNDHDLAAYHLFYWGILSSKYNPGLETDFIMAKIYAMRGELGYTQNINESYFNLRATMYLINLEAVIKSKGEGLYEYR